MGLQNYGKAHTVILCGGKERGILEDCRWGGEDGPVLSCPVLEEEINGEVGALTTCKA